MIRRSHHFSFRRTSALVICLSFGTLCARSGWSQGLDERAAARAAADQGLVAFESGEWAQAADLFGRAESLVHSMMHLLYLSRCQARLGKLIEAEDNYLKVLREPLLPGAPAGFRRAQALASVELQALKPRIPQVVVAVPPAAKEPGFRVLFDNRVLPEATVGLPVPVNPGAHAWLLDGPGGQSMVVSKLIAEGSTETVVLPMPPAAVTPPESAQAPVDNATASSSAISDTAVPAVESDVFRSPLDVETASAGSDWPLYSALGMVAVGAGLGVVYRLKYDSKVRFLDERCPENECDRTEENRVAIAREELFGTLSYVGFGASLVGLGTAAMLLFLSEDSLPERNAPAGVGWGVTGSGAFVYGSF